MTSTIHHTESLLGAPAVRFLVVMLGEKLFAINADSVRGMMTLQEKGSADVLMQEMAYRTINLAPDLNVSPKGDSASARMVLLTEQGLRGSIHVDKVRGSMELKASQILPVPLHFQGGERGWYRGIILFERSIALILNTTWLFQKCSAGHDHSLRYDRRPVSSISPAPERGLC